MVRRKKASKEDFNYDHNELVSIIKRHYQLLVDMAYLDPADVRWPPEAGWSDSELNVDALRTLERNETVIELLRHIPYPRVRKTEIYYSTWAISYLREHWRPEEGGNPAWHQQSFSSLRLAPFDGPMPPHLITLTFEESEIGITWVIDTERGCIYPHGEDYYLYDDEPPEVDDEDMWWLKAKAMAFEAFFDEIYEQISSLTLIPAPAAGNRGQSILGSGDSDSKAIEDLYREYGWPGAFRKEEFLQAAVPAREAAIEAERRARRG